MIDKDTILLENAYKSIYESEDIEPIHDNEDERKKFTENPNVISAFIGERPVLFLIDDIENGRDSWNKNVVYITPKYLKIGDQDISINASSTNLGDRIVFDYVEDDYYHNKDGSKPLYLKRVLTNVYGFTDGGDNDLTFPNQEAANRFAQIATKMAHENNTKIPPDFEQGKFPLKK